MITRSAGMTTGYGYLVGSGYEGKTKKLDNTVLKMAKLMQNTFHQDVVIRYNTDRESGGSFIKDSNYSCQIGIGAGLHSSKFLALTQEEKIKFSMKEYDNLPKDVILYHVVLADNLSNNPGKKDLNKKFKSIKGAFNWLLRNINKAAVDEYFAKTNQ